jgi:S1-C subfamily serine protease
MAGVRKAAASGAEIAADGAPLPAAPAQPPATVASQTSEPPFPGQERPSVPGYEIHEELGRGGVGVVYKARQLSLNRFVALKVMLAGPYAGEDQLARFRREAEAVARLQHAGIVQIYEVGSHAGHAYLALEYVPGGTLARRCAGGRLPPAEAARLVGALTRAVHYAHQRGIVHRDLKPSNVLLTEDGRPKITDFGLARRLEAEPGVAAAGPQTQSGAILGTPAYMAPEQAGGKRGAAGPPADVYALGAILYDLLTGQPPFQADNPVDIICKVVTEEPVPPRRVEPRCPRDLEAVCLKCLGKDPAGRYASAGDLADDLGRFLAGELTRARPATRRERLRRWAWRRRWWLAGCGSVACLLLLLVVSMALNAASFLLVGTVRTEGGGPPTVEATEAVPVPPPPGHQQPLTTGAEGTGNPASADPRNSGDLDGKVAIVPGGKPAPAVSPSTIYKYVLKSVVLIVARRDEGVVTGTGSLIDRENRLVLTNYHVVHGVRDVSVVFPSYSDGNLVTDRNVYLDATRNKDSCNGKVLAHYQSYDLALIQLDRVPDGAEALPFAKSLPGVGDKLHSVGNPGRNVWVYTAGHMRSAQKKKWQVRLGDTTLSYEARVVEADSPINPGDSGGPCVNDRGELIGVNEMGSQNGSALTLVIDRSEAEDFVAKAFLLLPELDGKKWARSRRQLLASD